MRAGRSRARARARARHRPPRRQARERAARRGAGSRCGCSTSASRLGRGRHADGGRRRPGHARLHLARAARGRGGGPAADVWAVGVMLWEALAGRIRSGGRRCWRRPAIEAGAPPLGGVRPDLPPALLAASTARSRSTRAGARRPRSSPGAPRARADPRAWQARRLEQVRLPARGAAPPAGLRARRRGLAAGLCRSSRRLAGLLGAAAATRSLRAAALGLAFALAGPSAARERLPRARGRVRRARCAWLVLCCATPRARARAGPLLAPLGALGLLPLPVLVAAAAPRRARARRGLRGAARRGARRRGSGSTAAVAIRRPIAAADRAGEARRPRSRSRRRVVGRRPTPWRRRVLGRSPRLAAALLRRGQPCPPSSAVAAARRGRLGACAVLALGRAQALDSICRGTPRFGHGSACDRAEDRGPLRGRLRPRVPHERPARRARAQARRRRWTTTARSRSRASTSRTSTRSTSRPRTASSSPTTRTRCVDELQEYLAEHARREGYALLSSPRCFETDEDLDVGEFGIATRMVQPAAERRRRRAARPGRAGRDDDLQAGAAADRGRRRPEPSVEREIASLDVDGRAGQMLEAARP